MSPDQVEVAVCSNVSNHYRMVLKGKGRGEGRGGEEGREGEGRRDGQCVHKCPLPPISDTTTWTVWCANQMLDRCFKAKRNNFSNQSNCEQHNMTRVPSTQHNTTRTHLILRDLLCSSVECPKLVRGPVLAAKGNRVGRLEHIAKRLGQNESIPIKSFR